MKSFIYSEQNKVTWLPGNVLKKRPSQTSGWQNRLDSYCHSYEGCFGSLSRICRTGPLVKTNSKQQTIVCLQCIVYSPFSMFCFNHVSAYTLVYYSNTEERYLYPIHRTDAPLHKLNVVKVLNRANHNFQNGRYETKSFEQLLDIYTILFL